MVNVISASIETVYRMGRVANLPGGQVYVGSFKDGLRDGWGVCTYPSGKKQNEYFIKGKYIKNRKLEK